MPAVGSVAGSKHTFFAAGLYGVLQGYLSGFLRLYTVLLDLQGLR